METQSKYYHAIDGLRALAVGLVLLFHAGFEWFSGGFIGVDIFFVISGFLITGIIQKNIKNGDWSFTRFYLRRGARLLPALFATLLATFTAGYFILTPDDLMRLGQVGMYAAISGSNVFFWLEAGYFDQAAASKPLLHTWSLGVEEQFYLLWPAILLFLSRLGGKNAALLGLGVIGLVSLTAALLLASKYPQSVFFLMPFRMHQFALGGVLALGMSIRAGRSRAVSGFAAAAFAVIIAHYASGDGGSYFINAAAPALVAGLFIWSAESRAVKSVFASSPLIWIGQRSYAIYLVHWPVMVLWPMATDFELSTVEAWLAVAASVALGAVLHELVEKPLRFKNDWADVQRVRSLSAAAAMLVVCLFAGAHFWGMGGMPGRVSPEIAASVGDMKSKWNARLKALRTGVCNITEEAPTESFNANRCANPPEDKRSYFVIGDSYASGAYLFFKRAYPEIYFGQLTLPGCILEVPWVPPTHVKEERAWCRGFYELAFSTARQRKFDGIIIAASWNDFQAEDIQQIINWSKEHSIDVVFLTDRPRFRERIPVIVSSTMTRTQASRRSETLEIHAFERRATAMAAKLDGQAKVVNMHALMCDEVCEIFDSEGDILYLDASHLSLDGVNWLAERIQRNYPNLLAATGHH